MSFFNENPKSIFENIKQLLYLGTKDRHHSFHTPVFTNINQKNNPVSRIVVLRHFDEENLILNFHTDFRSPKVADLQNNNYSSFVFYDPKLKIQLRIKSLSSINHKNKIAKLFWDKTKLSSRKCYLTQKNPSSLTSKPEDGIPKHLMGTDPSLGESEKGYQNFAVIQNKAEEIDWLYLDASGHKRLKIKIFNNEQIFNWVIP